MSLRLRGLRLKSAPTQQKWAAFCGVAVQVTP